MEDASVRVYELDALGQQVERAKILRDCVMDDLCEKCTASEAWSEHREAVTETFSDMQEVLGFQNLRGESDAVRLDLASVLNQYMKPARQIEASMILDSARQLQIKRERGKHSAGLKPKEA